MADVELVYDDLAAACQWSRLAEGMRASAAHLAVECLSLAVAQCL